MDQHKLFESVLFSYRPCQARSRPALSWLCVEIDRKSTTDIGPSTVLNTINRSSFTKQSRVFERSCSGYRSYLHICMNTINLAFATAQKLSTPRASSPTRGTRRVLARTLSIESSAHVERARGGLCSLPRGTTCRASRVSLSRDIYLAYVCFFAPEIRVSKCFEYYCLTDPGESLIYVCVYVRL